MTTITSRPDAQGKSRSRGNFAGGGASPPGRVPYRLSVEQYEAMVAAGAFKKEDRLELIEGSLVEKMTQGPILSQQLRPSAANGSLGLNEKKGQPVSGTKVWGSVRPMSANRCATRRVGSARSEPTLSIAWPMPSRPSSPRRSARERSGQPGSSETH